LRRDGRKNATTLLRDRRKGNIKNKLKKNLSRSVDAMDVGALSKLIKDTQTLDFINLGTAYINMSVLEPAYRPV